MKLSGISLVGLFVLVGCETIVGVKDRIQYEEPADSSVGDSSEDGGVDSALPPGCTLPSTGNATVRVGNFVTSLDRVDFCFKPVEQASYADIKPLIVPSGADCPNGIGYKQLTSTFSLPAGSYDVKVIAAGSLSCEGAALTTASQTILENGKISSLLLLGAGGQEPNLKAAHEGRPPSATETSFRFYHAASGLGALDLGLAEQQKLPAKITDVLFSNISLGNTAPAGTSSSLGTVDLNGYIILNAGGFSAPLGAALTGDANAMLTTQSSFSSAHSYTIYATGTSDKPEYPSELWVCDELNSTGVLESCGIGVAKDLTVTVFNTYLSGVWSVEPPRRQPLFDAAGRYESDVVCLSSVFTDSDKAGIINGAKSIYPYSYSPQVDWNTPFTDPSDWDGKVPAAPTSPPCGNSTDKMNALLDCLSTSCAEPQSGGESAKLTSDDPSACMSKKCLSKLLELGNGSNDDKACWACVLEQLQSYETFGFTRNDSCSKLPEARFAFRGKSGGLVLSKWPITESEAVVMPSTDWRSVVLRSRIAVDNGANVDVYCANLTYQTTDCLTRPYTGNYGKGATDCKVAWMNEAQLQSKRLVEFAQAKSGKLKVPYVVAIDGDLSPGYNDGTKDILMPRNLEAFTTLTSGFSMGTPKGYVPACTFCTSNPLVSKGGTATGGDDYWSQFVMTGNIPTTEVQAAAVTLTDAFIDYTPGADAGGYKIPLSMLYGFKSTVRVRP